MNYLERREPLRPWEIGGYWIAWCWTVLVFYKVLCPIILYGKGVLYG